jgi:predicted MFS family arabinose efflux permease
MAPCFFINAASYIAVLVMLALMNEEALHFTPLAPRARGQLTEGFRYVLSTPLLRNTLLMMAIIGTLTYEFQVILPLLARFTFHGGAGSYAALTSFMGLGAVMGGLYTASRRKGASGRALVTTAAVFGVVILIAAASPTLAIATAAMVPVGAFSIAFTTQGNATLQLASAPEMRGRVMALWTVAFMGSTPIGGPIIGAIGEHAGPRWGLATGGVAAILAAGLGALLMRADGRQAPSGPTETPDSESEPD